MFLTTIVFILLLSVLVFVHELGHFYFARKFGVKVSEFGFGFPPRMFGWKKVNGKRRFFWGNKETEKIKSEDTILSLNWIPLGGFVKIKGEDGDCKEDNDSFANQKIWKRSIILSAGVGMNVVLCAVCLMVVFALGAPQIVDDVESGTIVKDPKIQVVSVLPDSPAEQAGLQMGDAILNIDNNEFDQVEQVQLYLGEKQGQTVLLTIDRFGEQLTFELEPTVVPDIEQPAIGVGLAKTGIVSYPWYKSIWYGLRATVFMFIQIIVAFATIIKNAIVGQPLGVDIAGPVGIAVMTGQVARMGVVYLLQFTALLSMNLAIINFLPFPALDGGRVLFLIIEKIRRKPVNQKVEQIIHTVGFALLIMLILIVTGRDVLQFKGFFAGLWDKIVH